MYNIIVLVVYARAIIMEKFCACVHRIGLVRAQLMIIATAKNQAVAHLLARTDGNNFDLSGTEQRANAKDQKVI